MTKRQYCLCTLQVHEALLHNPCKQRSLQVWPHHFHNQQTWAQYKGGLSHKSQEGWPQGVCNTKQSQGPLSQALRASPQGRCKQGRQWLLAQWLREQKKITASWIQIQMPGQMVTQPWQDPVPKDGMTAHLSQAQCVKVLRPILMCGQTLPRPTLEHLSQTVRLR